MIKIYLIKIISYKMMFYVDYYHCVDELIPRVYIRENESVYYLEIYDILCEIEKNIINKKIDLNFIDEVIKNPLTLIKNC